VSNDRQVIGPVSVKSSSGGGFYRLPADTKSFRYALIRAVDLLGQGASSPRTSPGDLFVGWADPAASPKVTAGNPQPGDNAFLAQRRIPVGASAMIDLGSDDTHPMWIAATQWYSFDAWVELDVEPFFDAIWTPATHSPGDRTVYVTNPLVGHDWSTGLTEAGRIIAVTAKLTTNATVANRIPQLQIQDANTLPLAWGQNGPNQPASSAYTYLWRALANDISVTTFPRLEMPEMVVDTNDNYAGTYPNAGPALVAAVTSGLQTGDQWSNIRITYRPV